MLAVWGAPRGRGRYAARRPRLDRPGFARLATRRSASLTDFESGNASTKSASSRRIRSGSPMRSFPAQYPRRARAQSYRSMAPSAGRAAFVGLALRPGGLARGDDADAVMFPYSMHHEKDAVTPAAMASERFLAGSVEFEWDAAKASANLRKHGVSFEEAPQPRGGVSR